MKWKNIKKNITVKLAQVEVESLNIPRTSNKNESGAKCGGSQEDEAGD